ncbi:MAG: hypothetical protein GC145_00130 [Caulobacter sp.]|nr:hypothetical protein [Caulobacter sp.]
MRPRGARAMAGALAAMAVGLTALVSPALAAESPTTAAYSAMCVATGGELKPVLAAADAAGWAPIPEDLVAQGMGAMGEMKVHELGARVMIIDRRLVALIVGSGVVDQDDTVVEMTFCGVVSYVKEGKALVADMTRLVGSPPIPNTDADMKAYAMWLYVDGAKGAEYFGSMENLKAMRAMLNGDLRMLMVGEDEGMSMILRMRPIIAEKN